MQLADLDPVLLQRADGVLRLLEFHRKVATCHSSRPSAGQDASHACVRPQAVKEVNHLSAAFQPAKRLRFKAQMEGSTRLPR